MTGRAAEDAMDSLLASRRYPKVMHMGLFDIELLAFEDEHGRFRSLIETTDAPRANIRRAGSDASYVWTEQELFVGVNGAMMPSFADGYLANDFYRKILPELRRVAPDKIARTDEWLRHGLDKRVTEYGKSIEK